MTDADAYVVITSIQDPACMYLRQHVVMGGVEVLDPDINMSTGCEYLRNVGSKKTRNSSSVHMIMPMKPLTHLSSMAGNISSMAKITD